MNKIREFAFPILAVAAFGAAVFFQGSYADFLCLALGALVIWSCLIGWGGYRGTLHVPKTALVVALTLYWIWLGVSALLGRVGFTGTLSFWWLGTLPFAFWLYLLSRDHQLLWRRIYPAIVVVVMVLAVYALIQRFVYKAEPGATFLNRQSFAALLNLVTLPLCGYFLIRKDRAWRRILIGALIFLATFTLAVIEGRGATLGGAIAFLLLLAAAFRFVPKVRVTTLIAIVFAAFLIGGQFGADGISKRLEGVVANPWEAGSTRFIIWKQSWEMLKDAPWTGFGIGHYALYYPQYRDPVDQNAGFFVHNDYLQIWIEAGWPGLLLLLSVLTAVLVAYVNAMRARTMSATEKVELTGLFAGLVAVAAHSFIDFNLYVLAILVLSGFMLGRLQQLFLVATPHKLLALTPNKFVNEGTYRAILILVATLPLFYFLTLGLGSLDYRRALTLAEKDGDLDAADAAFARSIRLYPFADIPYVSRADLLRHTISVAPLSADQERRALFDEAEKLLARAEQLNPLRSQTFAVRAFFYEQNPRFVGADWYDRVVRDYEWALKLDPRNYQVRYLYARFLAQQGKRDIAHRVLEAGTRYYYWPAESLVPYYIFTAAMRSQAGDRPGAVVLQEQARAIYRDAQTLNQDRAKQEDRRLSLWPLLRSF